VVLALGVVVAGGFSSPARASAPSCADPVTSAPTSQATVSTKSTPYGQVLAIGGGDYAGCSLYLLTADQLHSFAGAHFACSAMPPGPPAGPGACDTVLWPALLTDGAPIAGAGVNPHWLGTVTRTDLPGLGPVQQVTYRGWPLYRFFQDETADETDGANLFDPVTDPTGIWYLVDSEHGTPAPGTAKLQMETAPVDGTGPTKTVLAAAMDPIFGYLNFPVYRLSKGDHPGFARDKKHHPGRDRHHGSPHLRCTDLCPMYWPPVLTSGDPEAGAGVDAHALGKIRRPDGTWQVTYNGEPLHLFVNDAYLPAPFNIGVQGIFGGDVTTIWGEWDSFPPVHS
jgi:predicted lipoprotein with Yx(FWY)xxD motif